MSLSEVRCSLCTEDIPPTLLLLHLKDCVKFFSVKKTNFYDYTYLKYFVCSYILGQNIWDTSVNLTELLKYQIFEIYRWFLDIHFDRETKPYLSDKFLESVLFSISNPDDQRLEIVPDFTFQDLSTFFLFNDDLNYIFSRAQLTKLKNGY
jgi:hypothetical protein